MKNFAMTDDHLTLLQQKLIIPSAVSDIVRYELKIEDEMTYNLHVALSEIDPDSALLAIAICAQELANKYIKEMPIATALITEATNIINEYAPTWIRYQKGSPMPSTLYKKVLQTVPEDLEALADLLDALAADLVDAGKDAGNCCALADVFSIQARAHMDIAEFILDEMNNDTSIPDMMSQTIATNEAAAGDNIVLFPTERL